MSYNEDQGAKKTIINKPLDWSGDYHLSESVRSVRFAKDEEGFLKGQAVMLILPNTGDSSDDGGKIGVPAVMSTNQDSKPGASGNALTVGAENYVVKPGATYYWERLRTPTTWKNATMAAAGDQPTWDPVAGFSFRLMGGLITVSKEAACAAAIYIRLIDGAGTVILRVDLSTAALVATGQQVIIPFNFPGNGYLSAAVDNILNLNLSAALTAGTVTLSCWGTEE